jgi:hypothetical protein
MGRLNSLAEHEAIVRWAECGERHKTEAGTPFSLSSIRAAYYPALRKYFALAALSRSTTAVRELVARASAQVFRTRVRLETSIATAILQHVNSSSGLPKALFEGSIYGCSKKQGVSLRMALTSCHPTRLCASACYAHDVLDAAPASVVRGVVNWVIAYTYERRLDVRENILDELLPDSVRAVRAAYGEVEHLGPVWTREPHIRFSHVGEVVAFPAFANDLARQIQRVSGGRVRCVIYTRHPFASRLDPELFVVNFTLDASSKGRRAWAPPISRIVYSAFGGEVSGSAEINFLEHHRWVHLPPVGRGKVCPTTLPETRTRTCDAVRCQRCFVPPNRAGGR